MRSLPEVIFYCIVLHNNKRMTFKLTLVTGTAQKEKDPIVTEARKEMFKDLSPLLGSSSADLERAFEDLDGSVENLILLERLMSQVGPEALAWFAHTSKFPAKHQVREAFFEDVKKDEDLFEDHNGEDDELDDLDAHILKIDKLIDARETLRFPKLIMFFWYLEKQEGREKAENLLSQTLFTLSLYEMLLKRCLSKRQVFEDELVKKLHPAFKDILHEVKVEAKPKASAVDKTRQEVRGQVGVPQIGAGTFEAQGKKRGIELQYFAGSLMRVETFTKLAKKLLDAAPKKTK